MNLFHCIHKNRWSLYKTVEDVKTRFHNLHQELDRLQSKEKSKKEIILMKDELDGKIKTKFVRLRAKT